jgi:hypothetical protein
MTLFSLIIVNNWNSITSLYVFYLNNIYVRIYFVLYYTIGFQITYNLIVASIIDHIVS